MSNVSKRTISSKAGVVPTLRFEDQSLTSFAGLVVFQKLFSQLDLKQRYCQANFFHELKAIRLRHLKRFRVPVFHNCVILK